MAVRLRLKRTGKKKQPTYRVVAVDSRKPRDGRVLETIGTYDPRAEPSAVAVVNERAVHWLRHGARPTETVDKLLRISGAWDDFHAATAAERPAPEPAEPPPAPTPDFVLDTPPDADESAAADALDAAAHTEPDHSESAAVASDGTADAPGPTSATMIDDQAADDDRPAS